MGKSILTLAVAFATLNFGLYTLNSSAQNTKPGTKLVEEVKKKGDEVIIPYKKYKLANGLTLLIHEDHSDPIVHIDVTYHVGQ